MIEAITNTIILTAMILIVSNCFIRFLVNRSYIPVITKIYFYKSIDNDYIVLYEFFGAHESLRYFSDELTNLYNADTYEICNLRRNIIKRNNHYTLIGERYLKKKFNKIDIKKEFDKFKMLHPEEFI